MMQNLDARANEQALAEQKKRAKRERVSALKSTLLDVPGQ